MKIMLINSPNERPKRNANYALFPPMGIVQLGTRINHDYGPDVEVKIVDGGISNTESVQSQIEEYCPDLVGIGVLTPTYGEGLKIAKTAKNVGARVVLGDDHASFFSKSILENRPYVDYVIDNDVGEIPFSQLVGAILNNTPLADVSSLVYREGPEIVSNHSPTYLLKNNNTTPDLDLIKEFLDVYSKNYNKEFRDLHEIPARVVTVNNARGCENHMRCTYCSINDLKINTGDANKFWETIRAYNEGYGINFFFEVYDSITVSPKYLDQLVQTMPSDLEERVMSGEIELMVYARSLGLIQSGRVEKLKRIGVRRVNIGLDAGDSEMLEAQRKNKTTEQTNMEAVRLLSQSGMTVHGSYILGALGETRETTERTLDHIVRIISEVKFSTVEVSKFIPLPNSPAWDIMVHFEDPTFFKNPEQIEEELKKQGIEIDQMKREEIRDKYKDKDLLNIDELANDWFENFTHIGVEYANEMISKIDQFLLSHQIGLGDNIG